jgi:hypothetical protein
VVARIRATSTAKLGVEQEILVVDAHEAHALSCGARIEPATAMARIDESIKPDPGQLPGPARGDVAEQLRDHALRQVPGFDAVFHRELLQLRHQAPMAADDPSHQTLMREVIQPALASVALAGGVDQGEIARLLRFEKAPLQRHCQVFGETDPDKAAACHVVAVADQAHPRRPR